MNFARRTKCFKCGNPKPDSEQVPSFHKPKHFPAAQHSLPIEEDTALNQKPEPKVMTERARVEEAMKRWEKEQLKVERLNKHL